MSRFADAAPLRGRVFGAEYLGTTQIVTVDIDAGPGQGAPAVASAGRESGETVGLAFRPNGSRCSTRRAGARMRSALHRGASAMAEIGLDDVSKRFGAVEAVADLSLADRRRRVRRAARADRRRQDHDPAAGRRPRAPGSGRDLDRRARRDARRRRPRATSPSCSSNIRSIRI